MSAAPRRASSSCSSPAVIVGRDRHGLAVAQTGPVSSPSSMRMIVTAVSVSPAMMARWIGAAPRQRGRREACRLKQPRRGASSTARGKNEAVGDDDGGVGAEGGEGLLLRCALETLRRADRNGVRFGKDVNRRLLLGHAAAGRTGRLRIDGDDLVSGGDNGLKRRNREIGRSHEYDLERHQGYPERSEVGRRGRPRAGPRRAPASSIALTTMSRFRRDRKSMMSLPFKMVDLVLERGRQQARRPPAPGAFPSRST